MADTGRKLTFADIGINFVSPVYETLLGKGRRLSDLNKKEVAFLAVSIITLASSLGLTIERMVKVDKHSSDYTFTIVLLVNIVFGFYYVIYGVIFERSSELAIYLIGVVILWVYLVLNYTISVKGPLKLFRLIAACLLCPVTLGLGCFIVKNYHDSGNLLFRIVGAKPDIQRMCKLLFLFIDLLKLDLQIGVSLTVLMLTTRSGHSNLRIVFVVVVGSLTLASFLIGYFGVRRENYLLMIISATLWISLPAYCIYCIVQTAIDMKRLEGADSHSIVTFLCCALGICTRVLILVCGIRVVFNFGKDLKNKVYGARQIQHDEPT
ncbi:hypothetical protein ACJMK2_008179 [Sinanodonta woodiana]|uniref:DUF7789 domain-containing protein n=1 Tax=Sinanodonta woodiana TaxID=1069815 RepID=A0ABD3VNU0_SINWO